MKRLGYLLAMLASMAVAETWAAAPEPSGLDRRRDVVRYGIESELMELVTALQNEGQDELNTELLAVLTESRSPRLREAVLGFFTAREWPDAAREAAEILARRDLDSARVVNAALAYLSAVRAQEGLAEARKIVDARETQFLPQAIHMLGRTGGQADAEILLSMYASEEATDALRQDVIQALGELGSKAAVDSLLQALDDAEVRMATRVFAAEALGKIGDARAVHSLVRAANAEDPHVRQASVAALAAFQGPEPEKAVVQALRDSVPGVRLIAARTSARMDLRSAEPFLRFRARNDPDRRVKEESVRALATLGGRENLGFLRGMLSDRRMDAPTRAAAFASLLQEDLEDSRGDLERALAAEAAGKDQSMLRAFQRVLSRAANPAAAPLVETSLLKSPDPGTRMAGIDWARRNKAAALRPALAAIAESDRVESVRNRAAAALAEL